MSKLRRKGIPLDGEVLLDLESRSRGPSIYQTGSAAENTVFDLDFGGSGYMLSLAIDNVSDRIIHLREFRLSVPWPEPEFKWLKDPFRKSPREFMYSFPPPRTAGFEREVVLNHCLGPYGRLNPGGALEGLLLGVGQAPIPDEYRQGCSVFMTFSAFDGRGQCYKAKVPIQVDCTRYRNRAKRLSFETEADVISTTKPARIIVDED